MAPGLTRRRGISRTTLPSHCTNLNGGTSEASSMAGLSASTSCRNRDPGLADSGLAVRQAREVGADRAGHGAEHGLGVRQRNAADEMHDGMPAAVCAHVSSPVRSLPLIFDSGVLSLTRIALARL